MFPATWVDPVGEGAPQVRCLTVRLEFPGSTVKQVDTAQLKHLQPFRQGNWVVSFNPPPPFGCNFSDSCACHNPAIFHSILSKPVLPGGSSSWRASAACSNHQPSRKDKSTRCELHLARRSERVEFDPLARRISILRLVFPCGLVDPRHPGALFAWQRSAYLELSSAHQLNRAVK